MAVTDTAQRLPDVSSPEPEITGPNLSLPDVEGILTAMVDRCAALVSGGRRDDLLNERFFHHMFSWEVARWYGERGLSVWDHLLLAPECPTTQKFRRAGIDLADEAATRLNAVGGGRSGNLDFHIRSSPSICVEWKGPAMWQPQDVVEVLLKLLTEPAQTTKVFAGILTRSVTGNYGHVEAAKKCFQEAVEFVKRIFGLTSLTGANIYAYLVTLPDSGPVRIHWGAVEEGATPLSGSVADHEADVRADERAVLEER